MHPLYTTLLPLSPLALCIPTAEPLESFDYIVVGGGTSGLVVANRLSADPTIRVAVVEPGADVRSNANVTSPLGFLAAFGTSIDWQYSTVPQAHLDHQTLEYHAGRAIGGTSTINGMTYIRGDAAQVDAWEMLGSKGWSWKTLWPYYRASEGFVPPTEEQSEEGAEYVAEYHGTEGLLTTSFPRQLANGSFWHVAKRTWVELGYETNADVNGGSTRGVSMWPWTVDRDADVREDAARAFYWPVAADRDNLVLVNGTVRRVLWEDDDGDDGAVVVAKGVEYLSPQGEMLTLGATKEVILSAGALRTPLILEMSGIGNPDLLTHHGIETKVDLPGVGENLQEQPLTSLLWAARAPGQFNASATVFHTNFVTAHDIFGNETDSIAASTKANLGDWAAAVSAANNGTIDAAAIEKVFQVQHHLIFERNVTVAEILCGIGDDTRFFSALLPLLPFSRGSVHLKSPANDDTINDPAIDPKYFLLDFDLKTAIGAGRVSQSLWYTEPMGDFVVGNLSPGEEALPQDASDAQWRDALMKPGVVTPNHHAIGTASMMPRKLGGVVDPELKVYGTANLRVIDASILPLQMSGHPTSTLYAVAYRAADLILGLAKM